MVSEIKPTADRLKAPKRRSGKGVPDILIIVIHRKHTFGIITWDLPIFTSVLVICRLLGFLHLLLGSFLGLVRLGVLVLLGLRFASCNSIGGIVP